MIPTTQSMLPFDLEMIFSTFPDIDASGISGTGNHGGSALDVDVPLDPLFGFMDGPVIPFGDMSTPGDAFVTNDSVM